MLVVVVLQHLQRRLQLGFVWNIEELQCILERSPEPLDAAVHPRAVRHGALVADAQPAQGERKDPGREDRFIVGADCLGCAVMLDGIQQDAQDRDRFLVMQCLQCQHLPAGVIDQSQHRLRSCRIDARFGQVQRPDP